MVEGLRNNSNKDIIERDNNRDNTEIPTELKKEQTNRSLRSSKSLRNCAVPKSTGQQQITSTSGTRRTVLKSIRSLFVKASVNLSIAAAKLKSFAEDALSSDEIVNELFLVTSSTSVDSSLLDQQQQETAPTALLAEGNNNNASQTTGVTGGSEVSESKAAIGSDMTVNSSNEVNGVNGGDVITSPSLPTFDDFDAVQEAKLLHEKEQTSSEEGENEFFSKGSTIWERRRQAWLSSTSEERTKAKQRSLENSLVGVSKDNYPIIYNSLIEKQKTLKKPMNLKDTLKIMNAGWIASKKWERAAAGMP